MSRPRWIKLAAAAVFAVGVIALVASEQHVAAASKEKEAEKYAHELRTSKDAKTRVNALMELGKLGQVMKSLVASALPDMTAALKDKDAAVRAAAAEAIGKVDPEPKETVPVLVGMMKDEKQPENVRLGALKGLAGMGSSAKDAVKDIRDLQKDNDKKTKLGREAGMTLKSINAKN